MLGICRELRWGMHVRALHVSVRACVRAIATLLPNRFNSIKD